jgi:hypothetical protein
MSTTPSNLVPGSIWQRSTKNGNSNSTVLFVTNEGSSPAVLAVHPQQVVFLTEEFKVLSMQIPSFIGKRTFAGMDSDVDALLNLVVSPPPEEEEEVDLNLDEVQVDETLFANPESEESEEEPDTSNDTNEETSLGEAFSSNGLSINLGPHPLAGKLQDAFSGYIESPFHTGDSLHALSFEIGSYLSLADIRSAFSLSDPNGIDKFEVTSHSETFQVEIYGFVDVMLESSIYGSTDRAVLYITSEGDFRDPDKNTYVPREEVAKLFSPEENILNVSVSVS